MAPFLHDHTTELKAWDDIKLLSVSVDRLRHWSRPGLLCIGDSAHAMSPIGGVGINLAIQDAVATANILWQPLLNRSGIDNRLHEVQKRREFPTRMTQRLQVFAHKRFIGPCVEQQRASRAASLATCSPETISCVTSNSGASDRIGVSAPSTSTRLT